jgi:hypothetical protein
MLNHRRAKKKIDRLLQLLQRLFRPVRIDFDRPKLFKSVDLELSSAFPQIRPGYIDPIHPPHQRRKGQGIGSAARAPFQHAPDRFITPGHSPQLREHFHVLPPDA